MKKQPFYTNPITLRCRVCHKGYTFEEKWITAGFPKIYLKEFDGEQMFTCNECWKLQGGSVPLRERQSRKYEHEEAIADE